MLCMNIISMITFFSKMWGNSVKVRIDMDSMYIYVMYV